MHGTEEQLEGAETRAFGDLFAACPADVAQEIGLGLGQHAGATVLTLRSVPYPIFNRVLGLGLNRACTSDDVARIAEHYRESGVQNFYVQLSPTLFGGQIEDWLVGRGLHRISYWSKLRRGTARPAPIASTLRIDEVTAADADTFASTVCRGYGMPQSLARWVRAIVGRAGWSAYLAWDGADAVAASAMYVHEQTAWLGLTATLPSHRRRGGQGAMMVRRIEDALAKGCRDIATETGARAPGEPSPSLDNMLRTGFTIEYDRANFAPSLESRRLPTLPPMQSPFA